MISVCSTHTINMFFFKVFVRLCTTVILFSLAFIMAKSFNSIINNNVGNNHTRNTNDIIQDLNSTNRRNIASRISCVVFSTSGLSDISEGLRMCLQSQFTCTKSTDKRIQVKFPLNGTGHTSNVLTCVTFKYR